MADEPEEEMDEDQKLQDGELTQLQILFAQLHEGYLAAMSVGFTPKQALKITIEMLKNHLRPD